MGSSPYTGPERVHHASSLYTGINGQFLAIETGRIKALSAYYVAFASPIRLIRDASVVGLTARSSAAPPGPCTRQSV